MRISLLSHGRFLGIMTHCDTLFKSYTHDLTFSVAFRFKNNLTVPTFAAHHKDVSSVTVENH